MIIDHVFRAYDIRGIYPSEIDEQFAFRLGQAFGTFSNGSVVVGHDVRNGSKSLSENFINGLISTGCKVVDIGLVTTPIIIFSTGFYKFGAGVIVTASHNPKEYNGFKLYGKGAMPISFESGVKDILEIFESGEFLQGDGSLEKRNILDDYTTHLIGNIQIKNPTKLKIVIDAGNGPAGIIYPDIFKKIGVNLIGLFTDPDGNFPNRDPDPSKESSLIALKEKVLETKADLGFAYDIDADRMAVVDEKGNVVQTKNVFAMLIKQTLSKNPKGKVIFDVLSSKLIGDTIQANEGLPIICRVGHTYITQKFNEEDAILGGELSGHYYFKENFGGEDSLLASLKLIEFLTQNNKKLSGAANEFPQYFLEEVRLTVPDDKKFQMIEKMKKYAISDGFNLDFTDGLKIFFNDGWAAFRCSNTAPQIVIAYEGINQESFQRIKNFANDFVEKFRRDFA